MSSRIVAGRIGQQLLGASVALGVGILTARWLGPEGKGLLAVALLLSSVTAQFCTVGLHDAASYLSRRQGVSIGALLRVFDGQVLLVGFPVALAIAFVGHHYGAILWSHALSSTLAGLTGLLVICRLASLLYNGLLQASERFGSIAFLDLSDAVLPGILWCAGALVFGSSVALAAVCFLVSAAAVALAARVTLSRVTVGAPRQADFSLGRALARYGSRTYFRQLGMVSVARGHVFLVAHLIGVGGVGVYSIATTLADVIVRLPDAVAWMLLPKTAALPDHSARLATAKYARMSLLAAALVSVPYMAVGHVAIGAVLPPEFAKASTVLALLLPGVIASCLTKVLGADLVGRGQAGVVAKLSWLTAGAIVAFNLFLIPRLDLAGAALGSSLGQILGALATIRVYSKEAGVTGWTLVLVQSDDLLRTLKAFRDGLNAVHALSWRAVGPS